MKTCLRRLCCNFCFILIATISKAKIGNAKPISKLNITNTAAKITIKNETNSKLTIMGSNNNAYLKFCSNKDASTSLPKKRKKIIKQTNFEVRVLPKGEYTPQYENDGNIKVTRKTMILKG